jgi:hypothetical protein
MEFKELTEIWKTSANQQEDAIHINHQLIKELGFNKIKAGLSEIKWTSLFELIVEVGFSFFLVNFLVNHLGQPAFFIPAAMLFGLMIFNILFESSRLYLYFSISPDLPILENQKKLSQLKKLEIFDMYSLLAIIPVFALPFVIVLAKGLANWNLYQYDMEWMTGFSIGSVVVAIILVVVLRLFPNKKLKEAMSFIEALKE